MLHISSDDGAMEHIWPQDESFLLILLAASALPTSSYLFTYLLSRGPFKFGPGRRGWVADLPLRRWPRICNGRPELIRRPPPPSALTSSMHRSSKTDRRPPSPSSVLTLYMQRSTKVDRRLPFPPPLRYWHHICDGRPTPTVEKVRCTQLGSAACSALLARTY